MPNRSITIHWSIPAAVSTLKFFFVLGSSVVTNLRSAEVTVWLGTVYV